MVQLHQNVGANTPRLADSADLYSLLDNLLDLTYRVV